MANGGRGDVLMVVRVLGPIDVFSAAGEFAVGGRLERMLLGALAISANHAVSTDQLAQILWGDEPPPSRDNALQTYIARLRTVLGHGRILSSNHSYELTATVDDLDALGFEALVGEAAAARHDPAARLEICRRGLALWRGAPFGDLEDQDPFRLEAIRLHELRIFVMEMRLESEIELGREQLVVGSLEALAEEYPYREHIWSLLVAALALSGRRVEALRACTDLRAILAEVGLEPSRGLLEIEDAVLTEDPALRQRIGVALSGELRAPTTN